MCYYSFVGIAVFGINRPASKNAIGKNLLYMVILSSVIADPTVVWGRRDGSAIHPFHKLENQETLISYPPTAAMLEYVQL